MSIQFLSAVTNTNPSAAWSHAGVSSGEHNILIVGYAGITSMSAVDVNGLAMTRLEELSGSCDQPYVDLYYLVNCPRADLAITPTGGNARGGAYSLIYSGVDPITPFGTKQTDSDLSDPNEVEVTLASEVGQLCIDVWGGYGPGGAAPATINPNAGQIERAEAVQASTSYPGCRVAASEKLGAASVTMGWPNVGNCVAGKMIAVPLRPFMAVHPRYYEYKLDVWQQGVKAVIQTSLADVFNRVWVRYKLSSGGSTTRSTVQNDTASQAKYGIKELVVAAGELESSTVADQIALRYLYSQAWPKPRPTQLTLSRNVAMFDNFDHPVSPYDIKTNRWCRLVGWRLPSGQVYGDAIADPEMFYIEGKIVNADGSVTLTTDARQFAEAILARAAGKRSL